MVVQDTELEARVDSNLEIVSSCLCFCYFHEQEALIVLKSDKVYLDLTLNHYFTQKHKL